MEAFSKLFFDFACTVTFESKLRLAPTPSGFLHLGNALNFTLNWLAAKYSGGHTSNASTAKIYLRIDDLDNERIRPEYLEDVFETLDWLKLDWDVSPDPPSRSALRQVNQSPIYQTANLQRYFTFLERLREQGLLFACQKSRRDLEPFNNVFPPEFREQGLSLDAPDVAWRIKTPPGFPLPDFIVRRRDGVPAYQVTSFADDLYYGITHVVRGADLEDSTVAQCFLAQVLSEDKFLKINFLHHPLVLGEAGEKLSKSAGATSLKVMRETGVGPEKIFRMVGKWLGLEGDSAAGLLMAMRKRLA
jgi:glutamyl-tRNA synthetase